MGESKRSEKSGEFYDQASSNVGEIKQQNVNTPNVYKGYSSPFGADKSLSTLNNIYTRGKANINKNFDTGLNKISNDTGAALSSRGFMGGGSYADNILTKAKIGLNENKAGALSSLDDSLASNTLNVYDKANTLDFQRLGGEATVNQNNISNQARKWQQVLQALGLQGNAIQGLDDTTWLDDTLAVANTAANFV